MNYEELVSINGANGGRGDKTPIGVFQKRRINLKYENVVTLKNSLSVDAIFLSQLRKEAEAIMELPDTHQLRFSVNESGTEIYLPAGSYVSVAQLLNENPAICADTKFINGLFRDIVRWSVDFHANEIYHVCFSPHNVFVNRKTNRLALVSHGSFYVHGNNLVDMFREFEEYIAPEVLGDGIVDERCDVYSVGKLFLYIFNQTEVPAVYKKVLDKATEVLPEDRYDSLSSMYRAVKRNRNVRRSIWEFGVASAIAALIVLGYFSMAPDTSAQSEYIKPGPKTDFNDILDENFDPAAAMEDLISDTLSDITPEKQKQIDDYKAKASHIFRKRYEREAERILSRVYTSRYNGTTERRFVAASQAAIEELTKLQTDIAAQAGIDPQTSQTIALEIIERVSNRKQKEMEKANQ